MTKRTARTDAKKKPGNTVCGCCRTIRGTIIDSQSLISVISHPLRKRILNGLFTLASNNPVTKKQLAASLNIPYEAVNYQLNEHLREFWKVVRKVQVRGAYCSYISPTFGQTVYVNIGSRKTILELDPFANLMGRLSDVGTRCDGCSPQFIRWCNEEIDKQDYFKRDKRETEKWNMILTHNGRKPPFTPIDWLLAGTLATVFESQECCIVLDNCKCMASGDK